jgi:hypothetical protein
MYLDIVYIFVHSKIYVSRKAKTSYNLGLIEYFFRDMREEVVSFIYKRRCFC